MQEGTRSAGTGTHAVVMGGSITGLVATRVLAKHFDRVTLVERDRMPDAPEARKGVAQMRHVHVLLKRGETILSGLFPGILDDLRRDGSQQIDMAGDTRWYHFGGWKPRFRSGLTFLCQSRPFLEWKIRSHVRALDGVTVLDGTDVTGFLMDPTGTRIVGIEAAAKEGDGAKREIRADLVVDATGRGSRTSQWLEALGYPAPEETLVKVDIGYATAFMRFRDGFARDWKALFVYPRAPKTRLAVAIPVENDVHMVTLVGWLGDHPPADEAGFVEWTRGCPTDEFHAALQHAEFRSPIATVKFPANRRRHYEKLSRVPDGLAVIGDALCSFNPIYGQGMTTGCVGAATLDEALADERRSDPALRLAGFTQRFQKRIARVIDVPWLTVTCEDFRYERVEGARPWWVPVMNWYTDRIYRLTWEDADVSRRFLQVMHLMKLPSVLFAPSVVWKALRLRAAREARPAPARHEEATAAPAA